MRNVEWFAKCGWGVFCHYLTEAETSADDWNRQIDDFDVRGLARQLRDVRAKYFFITLGQGSGHYCAPNTTYDKLTGITPSKCSRRDLVLDLHDALSDVGVELLVYIPADGSWKDKEARGKLGMFNHWCDDDFEWGNDERLAQFRWVEFMN